MRTLTAGHDRERVCEHRLEAAEWRADMKLKRVGDLAPAITSLASIGLTTSLVIVRSTKDDRDSTFC